MLKGWRNATDMQKINATYMQKIKVRINCNILKG